MESTETEEATTLGEFVRQRRMSLGLTQSQLGQRLGRHQTWASLLERGEIAPSEGELPGLATALGVSTEELKTLIEAKPPMPEKIAQASNGSGAPVSAEGASDGSLTEVKRTSEVIYWNCNGQSLPVDELPRDELLLAVHSLFRESKKQKEDFEKSLSELEDAWAEKVQTLHYLAAAAVEMQIREAVRDRMDDILDVVTAEVSRRGGGQVVNAEETVTQDEMEEHANER